MTCMARLFPGLPCVEEESIIIIIIIILIEILLNRCSYQDSMDVDSVKAKLIYKNNLSLQYFKA